MLSVVGKTIQERRSVMSSIWHDHGKPSFLGIPPSFSFHELAEIHQEAPAAYIAVMEDLRVREKLYGASWFQHNTELSHIFWEAKKPWWINL